LPEVLSVAANTAWLAPPELKAGAAVLAKAGVAKGRATAVAKPAAATAMADPRRIGTLTE
jgi:hypothetical protein